MYAAFFNAVAGGDGGNSTALFTLWSFSPVVPNRRIRHPPEGHKTHLRGVEISNE